MTNQNMHNQNMKERKLYILCLQNFPQMKNINHLNIHVVANLEI
jgi:hypothetical protein